MSKLEQLLRGSATQLPPIKGSNFAPYFDSFGDYELILLGDASHGTSEFYAARAEITKYLIKHHGFTVVALEADWPDAEVVDRYVRFRPQPGLKHGDGPQSAAKPFTRFPTWMWRNGEFQDLIEWIRNYNAKIGRAKMVSVCGLDLYSMGTSIRAVVDYLDRVDPNAAKSARRRYGCLQPWVDSPAAYGLEALRGLESCERQVVNMLRDLLERRLEYSMEAWDGEEFHGSEQNAYLIRDAEEYYKVMYYSSARSWSLRDTHMFNTLRRLLHARPENTKSIIWAHNSHCGDARFTDMGLRRGEINLGQLCREAFGEQKVAIIGCGTYNGTVAATDEWDNDMQVMEVKPALPDSWEHLAHKTGLQSFFLDFRPHTANEELRKALEKERNRVERFIGVIYRPDTERLSHYSRAAIHKQFDAYVWFDRTSAVTALDKIQPKTPLLEAETYPFGL